jgi:hypothetical protein
VPSKKREREKERKREREKERKIVASSLILGFAAVAVSRR